MEKCYKVIYSNTDNHIYDKLLCNICNETSLRNNFSRHKKSPKHLSYKSSNILEIDAEGNEKKIYQKENKKLGSGKREKTKEKEEIEEMEEIEEPENTYIQPEIKYYTHKEIYKQPEIKYIQPQETYNEENNNMYNINDLFEDQKEHIIYLYNNKNKIPKEVFNGIKFFLNGGELHFDDVKYLRDFKIN